jgi:ribosomal small subunit protein bTHX
MGKGDMRTKRGKIFRGTHGNSRRRQKEKAKKRRKPQGGGAPAPQFQRPSGAS